ESRWSEGQDERLPALAAYLVARHEELIVTWTTQAAKAAKQATSTIPIVMAASGDPIGTGLVASLAQPGSNITGVIGAQPGARRITVSAPQRGGARPHACGAALEAGASPPPGG